MPSTAPRITLGEMNRATLARQHLLERIAMPAIDMIDHLVGMQSQSPSPPFIGLWSRIEGFGFDELSGCMLDRSATRMVLMRGTVHLVTARDALGLRGLFQDLIQRLYFASAERREVPLDFVELRALALEALAEGPKTSKELGEALQEHWPEVPGAVLGMAARCMLPLVQIPPRGTWGGVGQATYALAEEWLGAPLQPYAVDDVVLRYLAAFGPATVKDAQHWCGLTRLSAVFDRLAGHLIEFEGPDGERLFDLPDAPRPPADAPAPPRLVPEWDNLLLSHLDRSRVMSHERRAAMATSNGMNPAVVLVDGVVAGTYRILKPRRPGAAVVEIDPFDRWTKEAERGVRAEAASVLEAMGGHYAGGSVDLRAFGAPLTTRRPTPNG